MIVVPMVLYPGMILISLMAFEFKVTEMRAETFRIAVESDDARRWVQRLIDTDLARQPISGAVPAEDLQATVESQRDADDRQDREKPQRMRESARTNARNTPPAFDVRVVADLRAALSGDFHIGVRIEGEPPTPQNDSAVRVAVLRNEQNFRGEFAAAAMEGILQRAADQIVHERLKREGYAPSFVSPIQLLQFNVATQAEVEGWFAGLLIPPILILLTITGTVYPAIDLTAGERERGTLETLMVAPVPTVDLIAGKFIVVALIGVMSAALNLLAFGGTMYLGGLSEMLTVGWKLQVPLRVIPWILLALVPLATMFGAILLAVSSFARSFKEAQNYVMPVIMAAMLPALMSVLPGTELAGVNLIIPVANIVLLTRELFIGHIAPEAIATVLLSTSLYAFAAVVIAARLFGQEAVLFADNASLRTMMQRRFFKPANAASLPAALLLLAIAYPLNFFVQSAIGSNKSIAGTVWFLVAVAVWWLIIFIATPLSALAYMRVRKATALSLRPPNLKGAAAALLLGCSTWVLVIWWLAIQQSFMPISPEVQQQLLEQTAFLKDIHPAILIGLMAVLPAICEEFFFRGYVLSGVRRTFRPGTAVLIVAVAFGLFHQSIHRLPITIALGLVLGLLVVRSGSLLPAIAMHMMHNGFSVAISQIDGLAKRLGWMIEGQDITPPTPWLIAAGAMALVGILLCLLPTTGTPAPIPAPHPDPAG
jgi:ABC-2 type transport system permease protein/sodium transport system permease protein